MNKTISPTNEHWPKWLVRYLERQSAKWPAVPSIRWAYIRGPFVRWEKAGAPQMSDRQTTNANRLLHNVKATDLEMPADYGITHLQKQSRFGFLIARPFCFYFWWRIRPQTAKVDPFGTLELIPGSERCLTFRFGKARWDALQNKYIIPTLQAGLHYD